MSTEHPITPPTELTDEELLRTYGKAKRDHCYEGELDDWPKKAERAASVAGLRAAIAADRARRPTPQSEPEGEGFTEIALRMLGTIESMELIIPEITDTIRKALEQGRPTPQPPADGEVAELVELLRIYGDHVMDEYGDVGEHDQLTRAAELLRRQHPQPVAVSERLPGPEDCDKQRRCWTTDHDPSLLYSPTWKMTELPRQDLGHDFSNAYFWRNVRFWLPFHALPVPTSEGGADAG